MQILVVFCHPDPASFQATILADLVRRLQAGGHDVQVIDLYAKAFDPVLDRPSWRAHRQDRAAEAADLAAHVAALRTCEGLVFVYPTWWYGLPAMLKGWLDRVWQPDVAFSMQGGVFRTHQLAGLRRFAAVTTHGSPGWFIEYIVGNPARRQLMRGLALQFAKGARTCWQPIYAVDSRPQADLAHARRKAVDRVGRFFDRG
jgi:putative NADPH-quinone reductase